MRMRPVVSFLIAFVGLGSIVFAGATLLKPDPHVYSSGTPYIGRTNLSGGLAAAATAPGSPRRSPDRHSCTQARPARIP